MATKDDKGKLCVSRREIRGRSRLGSGHSLNSIGVGRQLREQRKVQVQALFPGHGGGAGELLEEIDGKTPVTSVISADCRSSLEKMPMVFTGTQCVLGSWLI